MRRQRKRKADEGKKKHQGARAGSGAESLYVRERGILTGAGRGTLAGPRPKTRADEKEMRTTVLQGTRRGCPQEKRRGREHVSTQCLPLVEEKRKRASRGKEEKKGALPEKRVKRAASWSPAEEKGTLRGQVGKEGPGASPAKEEKDTVPKERGGRGSRTCLQSASIQDSSREEEARRPSRRRNLLPDELVEERSAPTDTRKKKKSLSKKKGGDGFESRSQVGSREERAPPRTVWFFDVDSKKKKKDGRAANWERENEKTLTDQSQKDGQRALSPLHEGGTGFTSRRRETFTPRT